jgi:hypothetical protein
MLSCEVSFVSGFVASLHTFEQLLFNLSYAISSEKCGDAMESFLENIFYESGGYSTCDGMSNLDKRLREREVHSLAY